MDAWIRHRRGFPGVAHWRRDVSSPLRPEQPGNDSPRDLTPAGSDSRGQMEPTRPLRLPDDLELDPLGVEMEEQEDDDSEVIYLDEQGNWALLLPEGAVLHSHGTSEEDEEEAVFYECESVEGVGGEELVRCTECGATITEAEVEDLIMALDESE